MSASLQMPTGCHNEKKSRMSRVQTTRAASTSLKLSEVLFSPTHIIGLGFFCGDSPGFEVKFACGVQQSRVRHFAKRRGTDILSNVPLRKE